MIRKLLGVCASSLLEALQDPRFSAAVRPPVGPIRDFLSRHRDPVRWLIEIGPGSDLDRCSNQER